MTFPMQLGYFSVWLGCIQWILLYGGSVQQIPSLFVKGKNVLFFPALKLLLFTGENLENIGKWKEEFPVILVYSVSPFCTFHTWNILINFNTFIFYTLRCCTTVQTSVRCLVKNCSRFYPFLSPCNTRDLNSNKLALKFEVCYLVLSVTE